MTDKSLAPAPSTQTAIETAVARYNLLVEFTRRVMKKDHDFGIVPGTDKPTLLKPGAEKLISLFGFYPDFVALDQILDFDRGLFYFRYRCDIFRIEDGKKVGCGIGSCNSKEAKYRWREAKRTCPTCQQPAIIKGKAEYGGGWVCFAKRGGCGARFADDDPLIVNQAVGRVENDEPFDLVNTVDKMAQKRAFIAATLIACNASEFFTQDVEDMTVIEAEWREHSEYVPPLTVEEAENVTNRDGTRYGDIPTDELTHIVNGIESALSKGNLSAEKRTELLRKKEAAQLILRSRNR